MNKRKYFFLHALFIILFLVSCKKTASEINLPSPEKKVYGHDTKYLDQDTYYDKVLGALAGSAIGDAMGASTEMWHRNEIQLNYGYITGLTPAVRVQSPEGTWDNNLVAGSTTDDTRWKYFMVKYFSRFDDNLTPQNFADFITDYYVSLTKELGDAQSNKNPDILDVRMEKIDWIKEWARVALAYQKDATEYQKAMHRFYGGEMSCAGQLYTPMFGLLSKNPEYAYRIAYDHSLFDLGYAKDISGLVAAMTNTAMYSQSIDSILNTAIFIDPLEYKNSRLVGRISQNILDASRRTVLVARKIEIHDSLDTNGLKELRMPQGFPYSTEEWVQQNRVYSFLEKEEKAIPFHSGEIWQILVTALEFGQGDFEKTMQFIVNYGRDNDTVAAVAGMILGAKDGFSKLPVDLSTEILRVNKEVLGIDLESLAREMTENAYHSQ
ncbi:ADP-ribosylglycohydrolase family protein [Maribacter algicola]|uniref:ADP-ribosylglycohydrolase family protein n=1 Tax=Meishania litoralis TaxID=3434685 RepID=A0ACC7LJT6_9FLAO